MRNNNNRFKHNGYKWNGYDFRDWDVKQMLIFFMAREEKRWNNLEKYMRHNEAEKKQIWQEIKELHKK